MLLSFNYLNKPMKSKNQFNDNAVVVFWLWLLFGIYFYGKIYDEMTIWRDDDMTIWYWVICTVYYIVNL